MRKRLLISLIMGAILGVVCILGAKVRYDNTLANWYLFSFWFNRVLIGLVIGLVQWKTNVYIRLARGLVLGLLVSFAFYSATNYLDLVGFLAGGAYGVIIEYVAYLLTKKDIIKV
jgi:hypothetical protein